MSMGEYDQPTLTLGLGQYIPLLLKRTLGRVIKGRDYRQVQVMVSWYNIPQEYNPLPAMIEQHHLMPASVPASDYNVKTGEYLAITIKQLDLTTVRNRQEVFRTVRR